MINAIELISQDLFDKVRSRYSNLEMGDEDGNSISDPRGARFFDFDYTVKGNNLGRVSISINERGSLKIFYSQGILQDADPILQEMWFNFLKEMRNFAKRRLLRFDTRDITKANLDKNDFQYLASTGSKEDNMSESKMFGSSKSSYLPVEKTKLIIRHSNAVDETQRGARSRNINAIYIENADGERFKYPYVHLAGGKAMQRHVANGGRPYDDQGKAIIKMSEQIAQLTAFKRHVGKHDSMHADANDIMERACMKLETLRAHVNNLSKQGHYQQWKEAFAPAGTDVELDQATMEDYKSKFTVSTFSEDLSQYFPLIHSIMHETGELALDDYVKETAQEEVKPEVVKVDEFSNFEAWATSLAEGTLGPDTVTALQDMLKNQSLTLGVDGTSAIEALEGVGIHDEELNNALEQLANLNSEADPIPTIAAWMAKADPAAAQQLGLSQPEATEEPAAEEEPEAESMETGMERPEPSIREIAEMVKSFYDKETGNFPLGETGVLTKVKKELGDKAAELAEQLVRHLAAKGGNPAETPDVEEASVWDVVGKRANAHGGHAHDNLSDVQKRVLNKMGLGASEDTPMIKDKHGNMVADPFAAQKADRLKGRVAPAEEGFDDDALGGPPLTKDALIARKKALQQIIMNPATARDPILKRELFKKVGMLRKQAIAAGLMKDTDLSEGIPLAGHPYHEKSDAELRYIIKDAGEAARMMKSVNPAAEAKYLDQMNDASTVLYHRQHKNDVEEARGPSSDFSHQDRDTWDSNMNGFRGVGGRRDREDDEHHHLDAPQPSIYEWYLEIDGRIWRKGGEPVTFRSKDEATRVGMSILKKNPGKKIRVTSDPNPRMAEGSSYQKKKGSNRLTGSEPQPSWDERNASVKDQLTKSAADVEKAKKAKEAEKIGKKKTNEAAEAPSHAELAQLAHKAYIKATSQGNGTMAAHYAKQYEKHKADAKKEKSKTTESVDESIDSSIFRDIMKLAGLQK